MQIFFFVVDNKDDRFLINYQILFLCLETKITIQIYPVLPSCKTFF